MMDLAPYEEIFKHLHANPELSDQEEETAKFITDHLSKLSPDLKIQSGIGGHGVIAIYRNGEGRTVLLRADFDALPVAEKTGLPYASTKTMKDANGDLKPVMHACGHDFHATALLAAAETLLASTATWSGTLIFLFQPAEERGTGAAAMVHAGLYDPAHYACPIPDIVLGQHVFPDRAGTVTTKAGPIMSAADSYQITVYGSGGHGSTPHGTIDPVVIAAQIVIRLQTIVSREVPPDETAVVTVGQISAGDSENIIAAEALLKIDIRSVTDYWRHHIIAAVHRIVRAECQAGRCPKEPLIQRTREFPLTDNDDTITAALAAAFSAHFGAQHIATTKPNLASEDFSVLASSVQRPCCFWFFGGADPEEWDRRDKEGTVHEIAGNHSPFFKMVVQPTLRTGVDALVVAAMTFVGKGEGRGSDLLGREDGLKGK